MKTFMLDVLSDRYKVGEFTGLLTSNLDSLKDVSESISRECGFRVFDSSQAKVALIS